MKIAFSYFNEGGDEIYTHEVESQYGFQFLQKPVGRGAVDVSDISGDDLTAWDASNPEKRAVECRAKVYAEDSRNPDTRWELPLVDSEEAVAPFGGFKLVKSHFGDYSALALK